MTVLSVIDGLDPNTNIHTIHHLASAVDLVRHVMATGNWMTIGEVQDAVKRLPARGRFFSENCISARIRDQRKSKHGEHIVNRRLRAGTSNLFEYQLILNDHGNDFGPEAA